MSLPTKPQILKSYDGKEKTFLEEVLIPVFRGLGYETNFNHGAFEFGKDLILRKIDDLGIPRYTAVVAKVGDIGNTSAKSKLTLAEVQRQVGQAWNTPFSSAMWREKDKQVSQVFVVTNGNVSSTAEHQIVKELTHFNKENTSYIPQERLIPQIDKYYPELWLFELPILSRYLTAFKRYIEEITETDKTDPVAHGLITSSCYRKVSSIENNGQSETTTPSEILKNGKRIWLQGGTGSGKTFVAHNYCVKVLNSLKKDKKGVTGQHLPIPVYLRAVWFKNENTLPLIDIIKRSLKYIKIELSEADLKSWITNHGICVFYDEFEMNLSTDFINNLNDQLKKEGPGSIITILSRIMDEGVTPNLFPTEIWHLKEINIGQASKALSGTLNISNPKAKSLYREIIQSSLLERLPRTPLAINILRKVFVDLELGKLPNNAYEFFDIFFEVTLGKWEQKRDPTQPLDYKQVKALLQSIAFRMVSTGKVSVRLNEIEDLAKDLLHTTGQKHINPIDYLHQVAGFGEVCRIVDGSFEFVQRTYLEFLAGCELMNHHWNIETIKENFLKINWEDSIIFAAGGKQKDDKMLKVLSEKEVNSFSERYAKLKNIGLISQALYHSSVAAKANAISAGANEAIKLRDDDEFTKTLATKSLKAAPIAYTYTTLHLYSVFYGKHALASALESLIANENLDRKAFYFASAYATLNEEDVDSEIFEQCLTNLPKESSPEQQALGGYLENREKILNQGIFKKIISSKKAKKIAKKTKAIVTELRRGVKPPKKWNR